ncbi:hypothetical protein MNBD_ALPHA03-1074, partial [hydrothermal vent metagenome]
MKKIILAAALTLTLSGAAYANVAAEDFQKILDDHWQNTLHENPAFASRFGLRAFDGKLADNSPEAHARHKAYNAEILARLAQINVKKLDKDALLNYKIFKRQRVMKRESYTHKGHLFAITNRGGWHMSFAQSPGNMPFLEKADYENYLGQLADYPRYNAENISILAEAIKQGYTQYCPSMAGYETSISSHITDDVTTSVFYAPFTKFPEKISQEKRREFTRRGTSLITEKIIPAYKEFYKFYQKEYNPNCRKTIGV